MPRAKRKSGPTISLISILLAATGLLLFSQLVPFQLPTYLSAEAFAAASLILGYAAYLRSEPWPIVLVTLLLGAAVLLMANWILLAMLLILPCLPYLRLGGGSSDLFEGYIGLLVAAAAVIVLPVFGISLMFVLIVAMAIYIVSQFLEGLL